MLKQRVITAVLLLAVLLPALFNASPLPFCALALLLISAGGWEWGRLNGCGPGLSWLIGMLCFVTGLLVWQFGFLNLALPWLWSGVGAAWVLGGAWLLQRGVPGWRLVPRVLRLLIGAMALWLAWLALALLARLLPKAPPCSCLCCQRPTPAVGPASHRSLQPSNACGLAKPTPLQAETAYKHWLGPGAS